MKYGADTDIAKSAAKKINTNKMALTTTAV